MPNLELYMPILEKIAALCQLEDVVNDVNVNKKEKRRAADALKKLKTQIVTESLELISKSSKVSLLVYELDVIKSTADKSWYPAITRLKELVIEQAQKHSHRSSLRLSMEKHFWWIAVLVITVCVFSIRICTVVEVTAEVAEKKGIIQRGMAFQKALRYDDWMATKVRKGGWIKPIFFWPIEPTEKEIEYAGEFVGLVNEVYNHLINNNVICNENLSYNRDRLEAPKETWSFIQENMHIDKVNQSVNSIDLIMASFVEKFPCKK